MNWPFFDTPYYAESAIVMSPNRWHPALELLSSLSQKRIVCYERRTSERDIILPNAPSSYGCDVPGSSKMASTRSKAFYESRQQKKRSRLGNSVDGAFIDPHLATASQPTLWLRADSPPLC